MAGENDLSYDAAAHAASDSAGMSSRDSESLREILRNGGLRRNRKLLATSLSYARAGLESLDMNHPPAVGEFDLERVRGNLPRCTDS